MQTSASQRYIHSKSFQELISYETFPDYSDKKTFPDYSDKKRKKNSCVNINQNDQKLTVRGVITNLGHAPKYS